MSQIGFISQIDSNLVTSLRHKYLASAGQARAANVGLIMGLEIPLPGVLQSPGQVPPPSCYLCSLAKEVEPVEEAETLCPDEGS